MSTENDSPTNFATASLTSAMHRLIQDTDLADLTITCGDKEWKVHSAILGVRSPFFKAAVTTNMVEKREMKIDVKDLDPNAMEEVLNFMYGVPKENGPVQSLLEAAERFQMEDLKEYAVKIARKEMTVENVVEFGHFAELYGIEGFLADCAKFIVKNDIPLSGEDISPKLAEMVMSILRDTNKRLKRKLEDCEVEVKMSYRRSEIVWGRLKDIHLNGHQLEHVGWGVAGVHDVGSALAKMPLSTKSSYFEMQIIADPGTHVGSCISIGLARKDYPMDTHPGYAAGSIAYHTDDGLIYMGSDNGELFGPRCKKGDIIGCGVIFPSDYESKSDTEDDQEVNGKIVRVYFTRNMKTIGNKEVVLPKGGFFPIIGMECQGETVKVRVGLKSGRKY